MKRLCNAFLLLLSFIFVAGSVSESCHLLFAHNDEVHSSCSDDNENDDCHLFIVHHIKSDNCSGAHDHFIKKENSCFKCEYYKEKQSHVSNSLRGTLVFYSDNSSCFIVDQKEISSTDFCQFLRGPPCFM